MPACAASPPTWWASGVPTSRPTGPTTPTPATSSGCARCSSTTSTCTTPRWSARTGAASSASGWWPSTRTASPGWWWPTPACPPATTGSPMPSWPGSGSRRRRRCSPSGSSSTGGARPTWRPRSWRPTTPRSPTSPSRRGPGPFPCWFPPGPTTPRRRTTGGRGGCSRSGRSRSSPRSRTAVLVAAAVEVLPGTGRAVDLCTGSGSVAMALAAARPGAEVVGVDIDPVACAGATANGVAAYCGDLDAALPGSWRATADVVTAVAPYVPTSALAYLPRDARDFEPGRALDGGEDGLAVVRRVVGAAARLLRPGGALVLELGGEQDEALAPDLAGAGFGAAERFVDEDGDLRAVRSILGGAPS